MVEKTNERPDCDRDLTSLKREFFASFKDVY
jgi:hypothetical protein